MPSLDGRLGLVIDGTGKDYEKISRQPRNSKSWVTKLQ